MTPRTKKPNILLISIDSLRADHLSLYGYFRETTPYLTELAMEGTYYENAFTAANWTGASVTSILTGLYPTVHGYTNKRYYLDDGEDSIASILKEHGYFTTCFSNNLYLSSKSGLQAGFDDFRYRGVSEAKSSAASSHKSSNGLLNTIKSIPSMRSKMLVKNVLDVFDTAKALQRDDGAYETELGFQQWLQDIDQDQPFFTYIHYQEPHSIYFPPYPYRRRFFSGTWRQEGKFLELDHMRYFAAKTQFTESDVEHYKELYDGEIAYLDWRMHRLFRLLKKHDLYDNTIIMVTADHGELFGENGFFWHAFCLYDPLIRVPLVVRYPDWFPRDHRSLEIVQTNDLVPTLLHGLNVDWKYTNDRQGQSFLNGSTRKAALTETYNPESMIDRWLQRNKDLSKEDFAHYLRDLNAYRTLSDKFISASDGRHEFYDLATDAVEAENLFSGSDPRIAERQKELQEWTGSFTPHRVAPGTQPGFDKATWEKMKALGYA